MVSDYKLVYAMYNAHAHIDLEIEREYGLEVGIQTLLSQNRDECGETLCMVKKDIAGGT